MAKLEAKMGWLLSCLVV